VLRYRDSVNLGSTNPVTLGRVSVLRVTPRSGEAVIITARDENGSEGETITLTEAPYPTLKFDPPLPSVKVEQPGAQAAARMWWGDGDEEAIDIPDASIVQTYLRVSMLTVNGNTDFTGTTGLLNRPSWAHSLEIRVRKATGAGGALFITALLLKLECIEADGNVRAGNLVQNAAGAQFSETGLGAGDLYDAGYIHLGQGAGDAAAEAAVAVVVKVRGAYLPQGGVRWTVVQGTGAVPGNATGELYAVWRA
jgi:hypothetical protein